MIQEAIVKIVDKQDLSYDEAYAVMNEIMSGETTATQNAAFLAALSTKSTRAETIAEISGCAAAMRDHALPVAYPDEVMDIVGTGGDGANTFNISTTTALVAAAGGIKVAKHGNRAASSACGTADALEALGIQIHMDPEKAVQMLEETGFCFFFAQDYHKSMKYVGPIRKELGIRTVFNILGPLTNPVHPQAMLLGVYDEALVEPVAQVIRQLGVKRGMVVHGLDRMDEISLSAPTKICSFDENGMNTYVLDPQEVGLNLCTKEDLQGGSQAENAQLIRDLLGGQIQDARRDVVLLNAGAAFLAAGKAASLEEGLEMARELIDSGAALAKLDQIVAASQVQA